MPDGSRTNFGICEEGGGPVLLGWLVREELVLGAVAEGRESCYCKGGNDGHSNVSEGRENSG